MGRVALAIRHVPFEDLGMLGPLLEGAGYTVRYREAGLEPLGEAVAPELVVVLGGPIGVYEDEAYPFLREEQAFLKARLAAGRPTLGICLGAQLMAAAMGADVRVTGVKEIGFAPLTLTAAGDAGPLRHLKDVPVLHWHGDMFDVPAGAALLAATGVCPHQGFALGPNVLALQFHAEAQCGRIEQWLIGHAGELAAAKVDVAALRAEAVRHGPRLKAAAARMFGEWLDGLRAFSRFIET